MKDRKNLEFYPIGDEFAVPKDEQLPKELILPREEQTSMKEALGTSPGHKPKKRSTMSKIRQMGYLVAASVSVVTVGTVATGMSYGWSQPPVTQPSTTQPSNGTQNNGDVWYVGDQDDPENWFIISDNRTNEDTTPTVEDQQDVVPDDYDVDEGFTDDGLGLGTCISFPKLDNLNPNAPSMEYGSLNEQFIVVMMDGDSKYIYCGAAYSYPQAYVQGASYDESSNTLTLKNCDIGVLIYNWMGNGFTINLVGENKVGTILGYGFYTGGSVTFTGTGSLTVNGDRDYTRGITVYAECSETCIMIDSIIDRMEVFGNGDGAISVIETSSRYPLFIKEGLKAYGASFFQQTQEKYVNTTDPQFRSFNIGVIKNDQGKTTEHILFTKDTLE